MVAKLPESPFLCRLFQNSVTLKSYNSYHSDLILKYQLGLLSPLETKSIPRSTRHNWGKRSTSKLVGTAHAIEEKELQVLKAIARKERLLQLAKALYLLHQVLLGLSKEFPQRHQIMKERFRDWKPLVELAAIQLGIKRTVLLLGITYQQYHQWSRSERECPFGPMGNCPKTSPQVLTPQEQGIIQQYLTDDRFSNWSSKSVYYQCLRDGALFVSLTTWYRYAKEMGISRKKAKKPKPRKGIRATEVGEWLHADVTLYRAANGERVYLYLLQDNFSRYILAGMASTEYRAKLCLENVQLGIKERLPHRKGVKLLTDDGTENRLLDMGDWEHYIAQKDISFSNSMVEAANKHLKYHYLFTQPWESAQAVIDGMQGIIDSYNRKPHGALFGLTPEEVFKQKLKPDPHFYRERIKRARQERLEHYHTLSCTECP